jgi:AcrR family transcriptional regulator
VTHQPKNRHPEHRGYPRGEETRARIVTAAIELFGARGFDATSTRDIAAHASVSSPALQYYFDSKEGLYLACLEDVVARFWGYMTEVVECAEAALAGNASDAGLIEAFCAIQGRWAELLWTDINNGWRKLLARHQTGPGPQFAVDPYHEGVSARVFVIMTAIVARLQGSTPEDPEVRTRTLALGGPLCVFRPRWGTNPTRETLTAARLDLAKRIICEQTGVVLRSIAATRGIGGGPAKLHFD